MSLVALKNAITNSPSSSYQTFPSSPKRDRSADRDSVQASSSSTEVDIESQSHDRIEDDDDDASKRKTFRIDARVISDATIGLSDGLTVPFALTAGLSALGDTRVVIFGGLAELIAGAISMGLGGYLGAKSEAASYTETYTRTAALVKEDPPAALADLRDVLAPYALPPDALDLLATRLSEAPRLHRDLLLRFQHNAAEPPPSRPFTSAMTIAAGYFLGGLVPLAPYFCVGPGDLYVALAVSVGVMAVALFAFGYTKTCVVCGWRGRRRVASGVWGGVQMVVVGGLAAAAAMGCVKLFEGFAPRS